MNTAIELIKLIILSVFTCFMVLIAILLSVLPMVLAFLVALFIIRSCT